MQRTRYLTSVVGTLLALGASFGGVAAAEPVEGDTRSVAIQYGDLELGNRLAIDRLYARIAAAAERACGTYDDAESPRAQRLASLLRGCGGRRGGSCAAHGPGRAAAGFGVRRRTRATAP